VRVSKEGGRQTDREVGGRRDFVDRIPFRGKSPERYTFVRACVQCEGWCVFCMGQVEMPKDGTGFSSASNSSSLLFKFWKRKSLAELRAQPASLTSLTTGLESFLGVQSLKRSATTSEQRPAPFQLASHTGRCRWSWVRSHASRNSTSTTTRAICCRRASQKRALTL